MFACQKPKGEVLIDALTTIDTSGFAVLLWECAYRMLNAIDRFPAWVINHPCDDVNV